MIVTSPGGMYNGMLIQDLDIANVSSERRNPIIANVMAQLEYMKKSTETNQVVSLMPK